MGRTAFGVRGISLREGDEVVAMEVVQPVDPFGPVVAPVAAGAAEPDAAGGPVEGADAGAGADAAGADVEEAPRIIEGPGAAGGGTLLTVTENGYGKRTRMEEYRVQSRGGLGIINIQTTERNGRVIGIALVYDDDELLLISQQGKILRTAARDVRTIGRATQGVRLIDIDPDDRVESVARLAEKEEEDKAGFEA
jgi:DNA gyrase/topoisomerase IV subunit A